MKIINNLASTHFAELKNHSRNVDELFVISPFVMESFDGFFNETLIPSGIKSFVLIITLKDNDPDLFKKARTLRSLMANCQQWTLNTEYTSIINFMGRFT